MRYHQIIEASMPFGKIGNTTGMTFGFESEVIGRKNGFVDEDLDFSDEEELIRELGIDPDDFQNAYNEWLADDHEGDWADWINEVGLDKWWDEMRVDSYEYGVKDNKIVRYVGWWYAIDSFSERMKEELNIPNIVTTTDPETPIEDKDYSDWHIEGDGSVHGDDSDDHPFEVISPVYHSYDDFVSSLSAYLGYITDQQGDIYTNRTTGLHINIGMPNAKERIDPLKLLLFSGEKWATQLWRQDGNGYTDELIPELDAQGLPRSIKDASAFMQQFISTLNEKSFAINFLTLIERGYVEFRPIGNIGYEHRLTDITNHISRFIQLIQIASDPAMYAQEYAKKLGKLIGGGAADPLAALPMDKRMIRQWLDGLNIRNKADIMDAQGNVVIDIETLIRFVGLLADMGKPIPMSIIKLLIKNAHMNVQTYHAGVQELRTTKRWMISDAILAKAREILDPIFGVTPTYP